jgi:hypothetical protein
MPEPPVKDKHNQKCNRIPDDCSLLDVPHNSTIPPPDRSTKSGFTELQAFQEILVEPDAGYGPPLISGVPESVSLAYHGGEDSSR